MKCSALELAQAMYELFELPAERELLIRAAEIVIQARDEENERQRKAAENKPLSP